jgi:serine-aspartate repeat-containing protein C/D/E
VGDWDGDGKDDIGVFGPDRSARPGGEAGLPDAANQAASDPPDSASDRQNRAVRSSMLGAGGDVQVEAVNHVLVLGAEAGVAVAGDFNGDGIDTIALFRDGQWLIDVDGDGRVSPADIELTLGQAGDRPVAGDFDGNGIADIGIYRDGTWLIQTELTESQTAPDTVIMLGGPGDSPVVGDWNDDGRDDAGVFHRK